MLMVGGNIPGVTRTVSIDIFDRVQASDYAGANQTALLLLVFCFAVLAVVYGMNRKAVGRRTYKIICNERSPHRRTPQPLPSHRPYLLKRESPRRCWMFDFASDSQRQRKTSFWKPSFEPRRGSPSCSAHRERARQLCWIASPD